jgi:hypothetical protein
MMAGVQTTQHRQTISQERQVTPKLKDLAVLVEIVAECERCRSKFAEYRMGQLE